MSDRIEAEILDALGEEVDAAIDTPLVVIEGTKGEPGADGITPTIGSNGNWFLGATDTGKPSRGETGAPGKDGANGETGPQGPKGDPGTPGAAGHTPVKGTDYWTAADKQEIVNNVLAALPDGTEVEY